MEDEMLQFNDPAKKPAAYKRKNNKPLNQNLEDDDPIMRSLDSAIGMSWNDVKPMMFSEMQKNGYIKYDSASFEAVAIVTDAIKKGVTCSYFNLPSAKGAANSLAGRILDPISQRPRYKLARGNIEKIGESEFKKTFTAMSFKSRAIM
jgi:predicted molibdopterin-dependent oxidoreductase YjgC